MKEILTRKEIAYILRELKNELGQVKQIDYLDINYDKVHNLLLLSPAAKFLLSSNESVNEYSSKINPNQGLESEMDGNMYTIPPQYVPMLKYTYNTFYSSSDIPEEEKSFGKLWAYIEKFINWFLKGKKMLHKQLEDILNDSDKIYQELREKVKTLENQYGDNFFECILIITGFVRVFL